MQLGLVCSDGLDNDGDGLIDFPTDPGCRYASSDLENPRCDNDDDGDGGIDWDGGSGGGTADPNCASKPWRDTEKKSPNRRWCGLGSELILFPAALFWLPRRRRREAALRRSS